MDAMGSLQKTFWILVITMVVTAGFIFSTENAQKVVLEFGGRTSRPMPLAMIVFISFAAGFLLSYLSSVAEFLRLRAARRRALRVNENLEREILALRNQPLVDDLEAAAPAPRPADRSLPPVPRSEDDEYEMGGLN